MARKTFFIKVYDATGTLKSVYYDFSFSSFQRYLNGGLGELTVQLPKKFDDFGEGTQIDLGYELKVYIADSEEPSGKILYSGIIDSIDAQASDGESITLICSGYIYQLATDILEGTSNTVKFKWTATDPSDMLEDVIDAYQARRTDDKITYTASSIASTGKSEGLEIYMETPLSAINAITQLSDSDWIWYIDESNVLYFNEISTTPTHYFVYGKDITAITFDKNIRETKNGLIFYNGLATDDPELIFKLYSDATSISSYGRRFEILRDNRFKKSTGTSDERGNRYVQFFKDPINTVTLRIIDSNLAGGYDIESIKPGDTCKVLNIAENNALSNNMLITSLTYTPDYVDIVVTDTIKYTSRELLENRNNLYLNQYEDNLPTAYTT